jgi:adenosine deaminase
VKEETEKVVAIQTPNELIRLPKTDIHCHLDGCLRPRTSTLACAA